MVKNKYNIERKYIKNKLARSKQKNNVKFLVAHETANNTANADNHFTYFDNITFSASAHTFIDDEKILEIIPLDEKAWHVQRQQDKQVLGLGAANDNAIGTELCRPGNFSKAYDRYVWYHAYLCKKYGLQPKKHIVSHKVLDPQRRSDPQSWLSPNGITWDQFIKDVQTYFDQWDGKGKPADKPTPEPSKPKPKPAKPSKPKSNLTVDGKWGKGTTRALQAYLGTPVDGIISKQYKNAVSQSLYGNTVQFGSGGSVVIRSLQKLVGVKQDGLLGPATVRALQKRLGTVQDGKLSRPSLVVKELQRRLNAGKI